MCYYSFAVTVWLADNVVIFIRLTVLPEQKTSVRTSPTIWSWRLPRDSACLLRLQIKVFIYFGFVEILLCQNLFFKYILGVCILDLGQIKYLHQKKFVSQPALSNKQIKFYECRKQSNLQMQKSVLFLLPQSQLCFCNWMRTLLPHY